MNYLSEWTGNSSRFDIATGYFEIGALLALEGKWEGLVQIRILMGDEVSKRTHPALLEGSSKVTQILNASIERKITCARCRRPWAWYRSSSPGWSSIRRPVSGHF